MNNCYVDNDTRDIICNSNSHGSSYCSHLTLLQLYSSERDLRNVSERRYTPLNPRLKPDEIVIRIHVDSIAYARVSPVIVHILIKLIYSHDYHRIVDYNVTCDIINNCVVLFEPVIQYKYRYSTEQYSNDTVQYGVC